MGISAQSWQTQSTTMLKTIPAAGTRVLTTILGLFLCLSFIYLPDANASTAGNVIGNQATATYTDHNNIERSITSNLVVTTIQQIGGVTIDGAATRQVADGGIVSFSHSITNTGNGTDTFSLTAVNAGGDDFDLSSISIYIDANEDGVPDNSSPIATSPSLSAGERFSFIVVGQSPAGEANGNESDILVTATSDFDSDTSDNATDTAVVTSNAVLNITKSISASSGAPGSGPYTYTLSLSNTGNLAATDVEITDLLATGLEYVANSGRYSGTGTTALGDAAGQSDDPVSGGITYEANTSILATIDTINPSQSITLSFQVNIAADADPGVIENTASLQYDDGSTAIISGLNSNTVPFEVTASQSVAVTGETIASANQGQTVIFTNTVTNNGDDTDRFNIAIPTNTFPTGSTFLIFKADGVTPLTDTNGDGIQDTGTVAAGDDIDVVIKVILPNDSSGTDGYDFTLTATSVSNSTIQDSATNTLQVIEVSTVDIMNTEDSALSPGYGAGPETDATLSTQVNPGSTTRLTLYIKNTSQTNDSYRIKSSTDGTFATETLPSGWTVSYFDSNGTPLTTTNVLAADASQLVYADVTVPAAESAGTTSIFFNAYSSNTGSADTLHNEIVVNAVRSLVIAPNAQGEMYSGGSAVYTFMLTNTGNLPEGDGTVSSISLSTSNSNTGFSSIIHFDTNDNGLLDDGDASLTDLDSIGPIAGNASVRLFVKVYSQIGVDEGSTNRTTLQATTSNGTYTSSVPSVAEAEAVTVIVSDHVSLIKQQALDTDNDGNPDNAFSSEAITTGAIPGSYLIYKIIATNNGTETATDVEIYDATPPFTVFTTGVPVTLTQGSVSSSLSNGQSGTLTFAIGDLAAGESAEVTFGIEIE